MSFSDACYCCLHAKLKTRSLPRVQLAPQEPPPPGDTPPSLFERTTLCPRVCILSLIWAELASRTVRLSRGSLGHQVIPSLARFKPTTLCPHSHPLLTILAKVACRVVWTVVSSPHPTAAVPISCSSERLCVLAPAPSHSFERRSHLEPSPVIPASPECPGRT